MNATAVLTWSGLALNLFGMGCVLLALTTTWQQHRQDPGVPAFTRAVATVRRWWRAVILGRRDASTSISCVAVGTGFGTGSARATVRYGFPEDEPLEARVERLVRAYRQLVDEVDGNRAEAIATSQRLEAQAATNHGQQHGRALTARRARARHRHSDVRLQLDRLGGGCPGFRPVVLPTVMRL